MNEQEIKQLRKAILKEINAKQWYDLTIGEIELIDDSEKRIEYTKKYFSCFKRIINPLYNNINNKKLTFTDDMTCRQIVKTLKDHYLKNSKTREDMIEVVLGRLKNK